MRVIAACILFGLMAAGAETKPQFTWQGQVDGVVVLHVQGKKVDVETKGPAVERQAFKFNSTLPDSRQDVRLEIREGRGSVRLTEQPRIDNSYTASIVIEDRQDGAAFYSLALYWNTESGSFADEPDRTVGRVDHASWSGRVTASAIIECRESRCESKVEGGLPASREKVKFTRPMPAVEMRVWLDNTDGPADFSVLESPTQQNNYTARVQIRTMAHGGDCSFVLSWPRPSRKSNKAKW